MIRSDPVIRYPPLCGCIPRSRQKNKKEQRSTKVSRKHVKQLLCLTLVLTMLLSLSAVMAAPYDESDVYDQTTNKYVPEVDTKLQYDGYTVLGDSIAAGFGDYDYVNDEGETVRDSAYWGKGGVIEGYPSFTQAGYRPIDKAYHSILAKSMDSDRLYTLAYSGTRSVELRAQLDKGYEGDEHLFKWAQVNNYTTNKDGTIDWYTASSPEADWYHRSWDFLNGKIVDAIGKSELVTVNVGSNDILTFPFMYSKMANVAYGVSTGEDSELVRFIKAICPSEEYSEQMESMFSTINSVDTLADGVQDMMRMMIEAYQNYYENIPVIVEKIHEANPDARIAVIGMYNPLAKWRFTDEDLVNIGELAGVLIPAINCYLKANAGRLGYTYVDVAGTDTQDTPSFSEAGLAGVLARMLYDVHPSFDGHYSMAEHIIAALEKSEKADADKALGLPYADVDSETAYADAIKYCYDNRLISGTSLHTYAPDMYVTRSMLVSSLYALKNSKVNMSVDTPFTRILQSSYYSRALAWAYSRGLTFGSNNSLFAPLTKVTREQMALMFYKAAGSPAVTDAEGMLLDGYEDIGLVSVSASDAVIWAAANGLLIPDEDGLAPKAYATRAEMAHALSTFDQLNG